MLHGASSGTHGPKYIISYIKIRFCSWGPRGNKGVANAVVRCARDRAAGRVGKEGGGEKGREEAKAWNGTLRA